MARKQLSNQEGLPQRDWDEWISERSLRASLRRVKRGQGWYIQTAKCSRPTENDGVKEDDAGHKRNCWTKTFVNQRLEFQFKRVEPLSEASALDSALSSLNRKNCVGRQKYERAAGVLVTADDSATEYLHGVVVWDL